MDQEMSQLFNLGYQVMVEQAQLMIVAMKHWYGLTKD